MSQPTPYLFQNYQPEKTTLCKSYKSSPLARIRMDPTTFQPFVTSTTPLELITSNDPTQEQSLLCSALHFVSAEPSPVSDISDDLRRLHQFARRRDLKSSGSVPHVPEPAAPQALSSPQIPGTSSPDSQLSYALQIRGTPHPIPPNPALRTLNPP